MNDFTKEELEHIRNCLIDNYEDKVCGKIEGIESHHLENQMNFINKLQSMIDGYCNHDQVKVDMGDYYEVYPCKKCWGILHE